MRKARVVPLGMKFLPVLGMQHERHSLFPRQITSEREGVVHSSAPRYRQFDVITTSGPPAGVGLEVYAPCHASSGGSEARLHHSRRQVRYT